MKRSFSCFLVLVGALSGCQREAEAPQGGDNPAAEARPAAPAPEEELLRGARPGEHPDVEQSRDTTKVDAKVTGVRFSDSGDTEAHTLGAATAAFDPNDTVYAEIASSGTAASYSIYAKWIAADGTVLSDYGMLVSEAGPKRTVISLSKPDGWPVGTHSIEIAINGEQQQTAKFVVR